MAETGVYIHIPFCRQKCPYCDFYSVAHDGALAAQYIDALRSQLREVERRAADTVYFGGGTPSLLQAREIARVLDAVARQLQLASDSEITLEANPETISPTMLRGWKDAGINRLSIGVQSTDDATLRTIGRQHTANQARTAIEQAHAIGFQTISADIMLGLPNETEATLSKTLASLCALPLTHVSAYMLKRMEGTPFASTPPAGLPDDDAQADLYLQCCEQLEQYGFIQYEISNFAKPGFESRHNLKYWNCDDYIGLGAAAHSSLDGQRYRMPPDLRAFFETYKSTESAQPFSARLVPEGAVTAADYIMLQLRLNAGLSETQLYSRFHYRFNQQQIHLLQRYAVLGLAQRNGDRLALTRQGMLVSNTILSSLL